MGELHAFFDRDVFIKLACCDLWDAALEALGVTHPHRLASATASGARTALRRKGVDPNLAAATITRLSRMAQSVPVVPEDWVRAVMTTDLYARLSGADHIDTGEALLALVALRCECDNVLVTGDKRFLTAMAAGFPTEFERLAPSIVTFESCLLAICEKRGFETVRERLFAAKECDGSLRIALGSDGQAAYVSFKDAMLSFGGRLTAVPAGRHRSLVDF